MNSMENNVRTFKDFLEFYNLMTETCFSHCADNFTSRQLYTHEVDCVENCAHKLIRFNNRSINVYASIQSKLMLQRQKEMEEQQKQLEASTLTEPVGTISAETVSIDTNLSQEITEIQ